MHYPEQQSNTNTNNNNPATMTDLIMNNKHNPNSLIELNIFVSLVPYSQYNLNTVNSQHIPFQKLKFPANIKIEDMKNYIQMNHSAFNKMLQPEVKQKLTKNMELFMADEDKSLTKGIWLDPKKLIDHYLVRSGGILYYQDVRRILVIKMLDLSKKSVEVNDSYTVCQMMHTICQKCGIANYEEYSLAKTNPKEEIIKDKNGTIRSVSGHNSIRQSSNSTLLKNSMSNGSLSGSKNDLNQTHEFSSQRNNSNLVQTIRRKAEDMHDKKFLTHKENLTTDEDFNWLNPVQTLREQGIQDNEELILRRRYFYSDQYIEESDPKQLKLLYEQCKEGILGGTQVIYTRAEVEKLASIQTFIEYGPYSKTKNLETALDKKWSLKDFIPTEFLKEKTIKKSSIDRYKELRYQHKFKAMNEYVKLCQQMPTYGITFYLVKERMRGRNKLVPKLFGVSKSRCVSMDPKKKEITDQWKLEHIKKWAAGNNSFMLDFGEHHPDLYAIRTSDGEQIAQLLAGYIDIILKNRQLADKHSPNDFEVRGIEQGQVQAGVGRKIQRNPGVNKNQAVSSNMATEMSQAENAGQVGNFGTINSHEATTGRVSQFGRKGQAVVEPYMAIIEDNRQNLNRNLENINEENFATEANYNNKDLIAATHQVMTHTCGILTPIPDLITEPNNEETRNLALNSMTSNLNGLTDATKSIARSWGDDDDNSRNLLRAAEDVMNAMQDLISSTCKNYNENGEETKRENSFPEATKLAIAANCLLNVIGANEHPDFTEDLQQRAIEVATKTAVLVKIAKNITAECKDGHDNKAIIDSAMDIAVDTSKLVTVVRSLIPVAEHQDIYRPVEKSSAQVNTSCDQFRNVSLSIIGANQHEMSNIDNAVTNVNDSIQKLLEAIKSGPITYEYLQIIEAGQDLINHPEETKTQNLIDATSNLTALLNLEANFESNPAKQNSLIQTAKELADATAAMVLAAKNKMESTHPEDIDLSVIGSNLKSAAEKADQARINMGHNLIIAANRAAICSTQLTSSTKSTMSEWPIEKQKSPVGQNLTQTCVNLAEATKDLINCIRNCKSAAETVKSFKESGPQFGAAKSHERKEIQKLCEACENFQATGIKGVQTSRSILAIVREHAGTASANALEIDSKKLATALDKLHDQVELVKDYMEELDNVNIGQQVNDLANEIDHLIHNIKEGRDPNQGLGEIVEGQNNLALNGRELARAMAMFISAATKGNNYETNQANTEAVQALKSLVSTVRALNLSDEDKLELAYATKTVISTSSELFDAANQALHYPHEHNSHRNLLTVGKDVSKAIYNCIQFTPGQKELDRMSSHFNPDIINNILENNYDASHILPKTEKNKVSHDILRQKAETLNSCVDSVANLPEKVNTTQLIRNMDDLTTASINLTVFGNVYLENEKLDKTSHPVAVNLKNSAVKSNNVLLMAKNFITDTSNHKNRNNLIEAAKQVTSSLNTLLVEVSDASVCEKKCQEFQLNLQQTVPSCVNTNPNKNVEYYECWKKIIEYRNLYVGKLIVDLQMQSNNNSHINEFSLALNQISSNLTQICIPYTCQAAYIISETDLDSIPEKQGIIDTKLFETSKSHIKQACNLLSENAMTMPAKELLKAATIIAKSTSELCQACKNVTHKAENNKRHFVSAAKNVAHQTALLVRAIKKIDNDINGVADNNYNEQQSRNELKNIADPLHEAFNNLYQFALLPEYSSSPAILSETAKQKQDSILSPLRGHVQTISHITEICKLLIKESNDPSAAEEFQNSTNLSINYINEVIHQLKLNAPGQHDCETALQEIKNAISRVDSDLINLINNNLKINKNHKASNISEANIKNLSEKADNLKISALNNAAETGSSALELSKTLTENYNNCGQYLKYDQEGQNMEIRDKNVKFLESVKTNLEAGMSLIEVAKECGGNPYAEEEIKNSLAENIENFKYETQKDVVISYNSLNTTNLQNLKISNQPKSKPPTQPTNQQIIASSKNLQQHLKKISEKFESIDNLNSTFEKSHIFEQNFGSNSNRLVENLVENSNEFDNLCDSFSDYLVGKESTYFVSNLEEYKSNVDSLIAEIYKNEKILNLHSNPQYFQNTAQINSYINKSTANLHNLINFLKSNDKLNTLVKKYNNRFLTFKEDLEATALFATAGTLDPNYGDYGFETHKNDIIQHSRDLIEATKKITNLEKSLINLEQTSPNHLISNEETIIEIIENEENGMIKATDKLVDSVKAAAANLSSEYKDVQSLLLQAYISVVVNIINLVDTIKPAEDRSHTSNDQKIQAAKSVLLAIMGALKTTHEIQEEFSKGLREFNTVVNEMEEEIENEISSPDNNRLNLDPVSIEPVEDPSELLKCMRSFSQATTKMLSIGRHPKNEDLLLCSEEVKYWVQTLISVILGTASYTENHEIKTGLILDGKTTLLAYIDLCRKIIKIATLTDNNEADKEKMTLNSQSMEIANGVKNLVNLAERMKNPDDYMDPNNPNDIAEMQLRSAAAKIEAAAAKLAKLQPRPRENMVEIEDLTFDEVILEAAKSIAGATTALVKSAQVAQKELIHQGRIDLTKMTKENMYHDGQWTDGLISAAQQVAQSTGNLCEAANETVQGNAAQEKLIVSAKTVSANTTTLVMACQVKADIDSRALQGLKEASYQVKNATNQLVTTAQEFLNKEKELEEQNNKNNVMKDLNTGGGMNDDFKNELKLKEDIERTQRKLEEQYKLLKQTRLNRYNKQKDDE